MADKKEKPKKIFGVDVNRAALKKGKDLKEFTELNPHIFNHLGEDEKRAYEELHAELNPPAAAPTAAVKATSPAAETGTTKP